MLPAYLSHTHQLRMMASSEIESDLLLPFIQPGYSKYYTLYTIIFLKNSKGKKIKSDKLTPFATSPSSHQVCSSITEHNLKRQANDRYKENYLILYRNQRGQLLGNKDLPPRCLVQHLHFKITVGLCHQPPTEQPNILQLTWKETQGLNMRD